MTSAVFDPDPLRPRPPGGLGRGAALALLVHALLVVALAFGVSWRSSEPQGITAELWSPVPQVAAPPPAEPVPPPPPPAPRVATPPPQADAEIALEKARREREAKERAEREKAEREQAEREKAERDKAQREKLAREQAERERRERELEEQRRKQEEARVAKLRDEQLRRIQGLAGATGSPSSTGSATHTAGPSDSYGGRVRAAVYPNITLLGSVAGNPEAEVEVRAAPDGTILSRRLVKSSGSTLWDEAVLRAIDRTGRMPRDVDGRVPSPLVIAFKPEK